MEDAVVLRPSVEVKEPYDLIRADSGAMRFQIKSRTGAGNFTFTAKHCPSTRLFQIFLGPQSRLLDMRGRIQREILASGYTQDLIVPTEFREFWVTWFSGVIKVGRVEQNKPFLTYVYDDTSNINDNKKPVIGYVTFHAGSGPSFTDWILEIPPILKPIDHRKIDGGKLGWVPMTNHRLPPDAMIGGFQNEPLYIARSYHNGSMCPGKYMPSKRLAFVPWGHREHSKQDFEVLCGFDAEWVQTNGNKIPENAFIAGSSEVRGEPLYVGRAMHEGNLLVGKVHVLYKTCYLPYKGKEIEVGSYEILVLSDLVPRGVL